MLNINELIDFAEVSRLLSEHGKAQQKQKASSKSVKTTDKHYLDSKVTSRAFCCESYIDYFELCKFIRTSPFIKHWAICLHDRDIKCDDNGEPIIDKETGETIIKEPHTHFLLYTYHNKTASAVRKIFDRFSRDLYMPYDLPVQNTLTQVCSDMVIQWRYLLHLDEYGKNGKVLYPSECRICDDINYWTCLEGTHGMNDFQKNRAINMFQDFTSGCSHQDMLLKYGMVYLQNVNKLHFMIEYPTRQSYKERKKKNG